MNECKAGFKIASAIVFKTGSELERLADKSNNMNLSYSESSEAFKKVIERVRTNPEEAILIYN